MYQREYLATHDIDAFFVMNRCPAHIASNGGMLSKRLGTIAELQFMTQKVYQLPMVCDYKLNMDYLDSLNPNDFPSEEEMKESGFIETDHFLQFANHVDLKFHQKLYCYSFVEMARRGFCSFDRLKDDGILIEKHEHLSAFEYVLIAWPKDDIKRKALKIGHSFYYENLDMFRNDSRWDLMSLINKAQKLD